MRWLLIGIVWIYFLGAADRHVGGAGRVDLESAGAMQYMVGVNGGDGGEVAVVAGTNQWHKE